MAGTLAVTTTGTCPLCCTPGCAPRPGCTCGFVSQTCIEWPCIWTLGGIHPTCDIYAINSATTPDKWAGTGYGFTVTIVKAGANFTLTITSAAGSGVWTSTGWLCCGPNPFRFTSGNQQGLPGTITAISVQCDCGGCGGQGLGDGCGNELLPSVALDSTALSIAWNGTQTCGNAGCLAAQNAIRGHFALNWIPGSCAFQSSTPMPPAGQCAAASIIWRFSLTKASGAVVTLNGIQMWLPIPAASFQCNGSNAFANVNTPPFNFLGGGCVVSGGVTLSS